MKPLMPLLAATCAGLLAGCANWSGSGGSEPEYMPQQGGPGYGPTGPVAQYNAAPEGPPPPDLRGNSDAWGASGGGGYSQASSPYSGMGATGTAGGGSSGSQATGSTGDMSSEPGIGTSSPAGRDSAGSTGAAGASSSGAQLDQQTACELQRRVSSARTPEERQALMDQAMPGMAPETQERHMQMMREGCQ
jgi:hypothetical protein